jgi:sporulation protein YlmC with PRC-barrel domain
MKKRYWSHEIKNKAVIGQHGRELGSVQNLSIDTASWKVVTLHVKLERAVLDDLNLKRFVFSAQSIDIPVGEVSGVGDALVLKRPLEDLIFEGGVPKEQVEYQAEDAEQLTSDQSEGRRAADIGLNR